MTRSASLRAALDAANLATCGDNSCMFGSPGEVAIAPADAEPLGFVGPRQRDE